MANCTAHFRSALTHASKVCPWTWSGPDPTRPVGWVFLAGVVNAWTWAGGSFVTKGDEINLLVKPGLVAMTADGQLTSVDDLDDPSNTQHHLADVVRLCSLLRPSLRAQSPQYPFGTVTAHCNGAPECCQVRLWVIRECGSRWYGHAKASLRRFPVP